MTTPADQIVELYNQRRQERQPLITRAEEVARQYEGNIAVPLPELDANERPAAVNLLGPGLDGLAMRIASVLPDISYPSVRQGIQKREDNARKRREANLAWWDMNKMQMILRRRARHLLWVGCSPVTVMPTASSPLDKRKIPHWRCRDPLNAFPAPCDDHDIEPLDCIFSFRRSLGWLRAKYPVAAANLEVGKDARPDMALTLLEYNDSDETVLVVLGVPREANPQAQGPLWTPPASTTARNQRPGRPFEELDRDPNRAGIPLTVIPGRITLRSLMGAFDSIIGLFQRAAKIDALETLGIQRAIFPDLWAVSHPASPMGVKIVKLADGKTGQVGTIQGGTIQQILTQPSLQVPQALDRYERSQRIAAGIPAEFSGESGTNIRTARRGEMVLGAAVDMTIQENQDIFAASLEAEDRRAIAVMRGWHNRPTSFYVPMSGTPPMTDYTPADVFDESDIHFVKYSMPGADAAGMVVEMGQRVGTGEMSLDTMRRMDPAIEDADQEAAQVEVEGLNKAMLAGLEQQAAQGQLDIPTIAAITEKRRANPMMPLSRCFIEVHQEMQASQAQNAAQPPGPTDPNAQPGLGQAPQGQPAIPGAAPSMQNLAQILGSLRQPQQQSQGEQAFNQPPAPIASRAVRATRRDLSAFVEAHAAEILETLPFDDQLENETQLVPTGAVLLVRFSSLDEDEDGMVERIFQVNTPDLGACAALGLLTWAQKEG